MSSNAPEQTPPLFNQAYLDTPDDLKDAVHDWEVGLRDTITYVSNGKPVLAPGTCPGGPNVGKPFFQFLPLRKSFEEGGTMVCESENCISFIPAGFRNAQTPNTMNPAREEIGGSGAGEVPSLVEGGRNLADDGGSPDGAPRRLAARDFARRARAA